ncbi:MAG TPA: glycosyltransferase [Vicinamibacterales bacterium]|jgi:GT2 family glycosyltransferase|nr:glycosyltransferase [Vicinamibacterales bacterium]
MSANAPSLSFIVPVRDDASRLERCLDAIRANGYGGEVRVVVADNGSTDKSGDVARRAGATVLTLPGLSVAELRNRASAQADTDILAFVDADHLIAPGWIAAAAENLRGAGPAAAGAPYDPAPNANWVQRAYDRFRDHTPGLRETQWLGSGNLAIRRDVFVRVGGFDTALETCEDVDLCYRLVAAGERLLQDDRMKSVHMGDPSTLRALFFGELWRGRDNIRVSLRGPKTARALQSVVVPVANLVFVAAILAGIATAVFGGWRLALMAVGGFGALVSVRAARMSAGTRGSWRTVPADFAVAAVYDIGRALALVARASHKARRESAGERAGA